MPHELNQDQRDIQKAAQEFAGGEFLSRVALEHDGARRFPREIWKKACDLGFIGVHFPESLGGQGLGTFENILVTEQFCRKDSGLGIALSLADFTSEILLRTENQSQKARFLTPITQGVLVSAGAFVEAETGYDFREIVTTAQSDGNSYVLNGRKSLVINGLESNWFMILCQTDSEAKPKYKGQSLFIAERGTEGLEIIPGGDKMGIHMTSITELAFSNMRVPSENRIGSEGEGFYEVSKFVEESRIETAAQAVGIGQGALEQAVAYARNRFQFGQPIIENQGLQWMLADMAILVEAARTFLYRVARRFDRNDGHADPQTAMLKIFASDTAMKVATDAVQVMGGYGYMEDYPLERMMRDATATGVYLETNQIQKRVVADDLKRKG